MNTQVGEHMEVQTVPPPQPCPIHLFIWLVTSCTFYSKLVMVSKMLS